MDDTKCIGWLYEQLIEKYFWFLLKKNKKQIEFWTNRSPVELHYVHFAIYLGRLIM